MIVGWLTPALRASSAIVMRVASFFPFQATYYLNGHAFIERELQRHQIAFRKNDNAFLAVDDLAQLQAAADRLSPDLIRQSTARIGAAVVVNQLSSRRDSVFELATAKRKLFRVLYKVK